MSDNEIKFGERPAVEKPAERAVEKPAAEKPVERPLAGRTGITARDFLSSSEALRRYNKYVRVGFERYLATNGLYAVSKTEAEWTKLLKQYAE